jgi:CRISP-associated protein Cas1
MGNAAYLKCKNKQLVVTLTDSGEVRNVPLEDIGILVLDHHSITVSQQVLALLLENNAAVITCNYNHHPTGLLLNLDGHTTQQERFEAQVNATEPLKKQLWQQTVKAKLRNQAKVLAICDREDAYLRNLANKVLSGDSSNCEAQGAAYYWKHLFDGDFYRRREGEPPNNLLNYAYAILRACVARALVGSGLMPTLGIFHRNRYNSYCLADDIMEPFRPFADLMVWEIVDEGHDIDFLDKSLKAQLLKLPALDIIINGEKSPLMVGLQKTTASLVKCFEGKQKKIAYPELP